MEADSPLEPSGSSGDWAFLQVKALQPALPRAQWKPNRPKPSGKPVGSPVSGCPLSAIVAGQALWKAQ